MEDLFDSWDDVAGELSTPLLLLLDYDGTLTPIVDRPEDALLSDDARILLKELSEKQGLYVAVVSGRPLQQVKELVGVEIYYAGNHGLEAEGPGFMFKHPDLEGVEGKVDAVCRTLEEIDVEGVIVEDKKLSAVLHYRLADDEKAVRGAFDKVVEPYLSQGFRVAENKKTLELVPDVEWGKGDVALKLADEVGADSIMYYGDDNTDEHAFKKLSRHVTVAVGRRDSAAKYYVEDVKAVIYSLGQVLYLSSNTPFNSLR